MKIDAGIGSDLGRSGQEARRLEEIGYDGVKVAELNHDPFLPLTIAAEHTDKIELLTSVAVALSRNPMTMANLAHDLNAFSGGRFVLGLGSQVQPHIVKRFSMPWYKPARQMREFIEAMHAIFDCWYDGERLDFRGEYYQHTLMPATFTPTNTEFGRPRIFLSATGPLMTRVAAEVADGLIMHPFSTEKYIREVTLPAVEEGLANSARSRQDFEIDYAPMIVSGTNEDELNRAREAVRGRIAFYGSTPAYRRVLDMHGWGDLQGELNMMSKRRQSDEMAALVDDEIVNTFAVVGEPETVIDEMLERFGSIVDRTGFNVPSLADSKLADLLSRLHG